MPILRRLHLTEPVIQAPMAGVSTPAMAAAVSNAGALGSLGIGAADVATARTMIRQTRALTPNAFNVNLFVHEPAARDARVEADWLRWLEPQFERFNTHAPAQLREIYSSFAVGDAMLQMLLEERPGVVSFHFGLPTDEAITALRGSGATLLACATSLHEARLIARRDIDGIIAQGTEAGGHRGVFDPSAVDEELGTMALTRLLVQKLDRPVIAAGGIMDGAGIAAALALGAAAAQLGTAFVACAESAIDTGYRRALLDPDATTVFTSSISGRKARCLVNEFTTLDGDPRRPKVPAYPVAYDAGKALHKAASATGVYGFGAQWAGQAVRLSRELPAGELVQTLRRELDAALAKPTRRA